MELHIAVKTVKQAFVKAIVKCAVLHLGALLGRAAWKAATTASRVCEVVQSWEDKGLHATNVWRAREMLARQWWLGTLRPSPPLDPLEACGVVPGEASACWWRLLLQPRQAGRFLACLEERVLEAEHDHEAFRARLCWGVILALVVPLALMAAWGLVRRWVMGINGHQESPSADYFVDAPEADAGKALVEDWATPVADVDVTEETRIAESEKVKEEGGGKMYTDVDKTDDNANNKSADKAKEAAEVPPVTDNFVQHTVVSEDPKGLAAQEPPSSTLAAEAALSEGKAAMKKKKKRQRKRKNLGPADELKAPGDVHVKDDDKTDAKIDIKKDTPKDEAKGKAVPKPQIKKKEAPKNEAKGKAVPKPEVKKKAPKDEPKGKAVPKPEVKKKAVPKPEVKKKAPKDEANRKAVPKPEVKKKAVPKPEVMEKEKSVVKNVAVKVTRRKKKPAPAQPKAAPPSLPLNSVRQSWQEDVVTLRLPVPPARRMHVIGPRGDTVQQLRRDYPGVHVAVPLPKDADAHVTFRGPKSQAAAASQEVATHLQAIDAEIREAARLRQQAVATAVLDVAPNRRRLVVGPGGEELLKLQQQHPGVRVSVPPAIDTESRSVTITGPPAEVSAVEAKIKNRLAAIERQRQLLKARRRRRHQGAPSAPGASPAKGC